MEMKKLAVASPLANTLLSTYRQWFGLKSSDDYCVINVWAVGIVYMKSSCDP